MEVTFGNHELTVNKIEEGLFIFEVVLDGERIGKIRKDSDKYFGEISDANKTFITSLNNLGLSSKDLVAEIKGEAKRDYSAVKFGMDANGADAKDLAKAVEVGYISMSKAMNTDY